MQRSSDLDARLLAAHRDDDRARLVTLYTEAANTAEAEGDVDRACFFLTHAWIFALESRHHDAAALKARLVAHGRDRD